MIKYALLLLLLSGSTFSSAGIAADVFDLTLKIRQARELFDSRRFRDAELAFAKLREAHKPVRQQNLDSYLNVLDHLARSISQQGKTGSVLSLLQERHVLVAQGYDSRGFVFASSMTRLAEAMYREGNRSGALNFIDYAISVYEELRPVPEEALSLAKSNRLQYKVAQFSTAMLPMDLSDFYTSCELLDSGKAKRSADHLMSAYVEVGVDYIPEGEWADHFDMLARQEKTSHKKSGNAKQRIFLPHSSERMRNDLCFVNESAENAGLLSADSGFDQ